MPTYTLCGGDVDIAADEWKTIIHAHLEINHPETNTHTRTHTHPHMQDKRIYQCWGVTLQSTVVCLIRMSFEPEFTLNNVTKLTADCEHPFCKWDCDLNEQETTTKHKGVMIWRRQIFKLRAQPTGLTLTLGYSFSGWRIWVTVDPLQLCEVRLSKNFSLNKPLGESCDSYLQVPFHLWLGKPEPKWAKVFHSD